MTDIVHEILNRMKQRIADAYGLPDEVADLFGLVENEIKTEYGGERVHINKPTQDKRKKIEAVRAEYIHSDQPPEQIASRHGISRATLYNYLKRRDV